MATFTMELREIMGKGIDIGLNDYPIFDEEYRPRLNESITGHFHYREIGYETIDMFINRFKQKMNLLMPVYNKLFLSTLMEFDALTSTRMTTDSQGIGNEKSVASATSESSSASSSDSDSKSRSVGSDFPQTMLSDSGDYASSASDSVSDSAVTSAGADASEQASTQQGERESTSHTVMEGYTRSPAELVLLYRETLINVDAMLIADLEPLFMQIWSNGDESGDYPHMYPYGFILGGMY